MNTLLSFLALSCLCGVSTAFFGKSFFSRNSPITKRDCQWMAWGPVGRCKPYSDTSRLAALQTRDRVPARDGGNDCVGSNKRYVTCTELEYVASTFLDAVTSQAGANYAISGKGSSHGNANRFAPDIDCTTNFTDAAGKVRMLGNSCQMPKRRRRSANGNIEVDEEPMMERIRKKRQIPESPMKHRDMLFLIDGSGSVGPHNLKKIVRLARAIVGDLCGAVGIGKQKTRVGIVVFDSTQHPVLDFDELFEKAQIFTHMDSKVTYTSRTAGVSCLNDALEYARTKMFIKDRGARMNTGSVEQTIVLITDGCTNCVNQGDRRTILKDMRIKLEDDGISIIVYFIGDLGQCQTSMNDLLIGERCFGLFTVISWAQLDGVSAYIEDIKEERECTDSWATAPSCSKSFSPPQNEIPMNCTNDLTK